MKSDGMHRKTSVVTLSIAAATAVTLSNAFNMEDYSGGVIQFTSTSLTTNAPGLAFRVCDTSTGTFSNLYGSTGNLIQVSLVARATGHAVAMPDELFGAHWVKAWIQKSGTYVAQAAAKSFIVTLKA